MRRWHAERSDLRLAALRAPTLVLAGAQDAIIPAVNSELLAAAIPGARLERFPGGGHGFIAQEPARCAAAIRDFLLSLERASEGKNRA